MARIRTGKPNGRPPKAVSQEDGTIDFHANLPADFIDKVDRLKKGAETRKDVIVRILKDYPE